MTVAADSDLLDLGTLAAGVSPSVTLTGLSASDGFSGRVVAAALDTTFSNINSVTGGASGSDSLRGADRAAAWTVGDSNSYRDTASGETLSFSAFSELAGGSMADTLTIDVDKQVAWSINAADSGTLRSGALGHSFSAMENLVGGSGDDAFDFVAAGSVSGTVTGGIGRDVMDFTKIDDGVSLAVTLTGTSASGFAGTTLLGTINAGFNGINAINGSLGATDSLQGLDSASTWTVGAGSNYRDMGSGRALMFSEFTELVGGAGMDTITSTSSLASTWTISGVDSGMFAAASVSQGFAAMENLVGVGGADVFSFTTGSRISGLIDGGSGEDSIDLGSIGSAVGLTVTLGAVSATDGFSGTVQAGSMATAFANINAASGSSSNADILQGRDSAAVWTVAATGGAYRDTGSGATLGFSGFAEIAGGAAADTVRHDLDGTVTWEITGAGSGSLRAASLRQGFSGVEELSGGKGADVFSFAAGGSVSGSVDGAAGTNTLDFVNTDSDTMLAVTLGSALATSGWSGTMSYGSHECSLQQYQHYKCWRWHCR